MGITKFAVKYPVSVLMITLGVCLLGIISYNKLGTDLFPDLKNPALYIDLQAGERPPEEIEKQFVEKIEAMAARQEGVKDVSSSSKVGGATITVEYDCRLFGFATQHVSNRSGRRNHFPECFPLRCQCHAGHDHFHEP